MSSSGAAGLRAAGRGSSFSLASRAQRRAALRGRRERTAWDRTCLGQLPGDFQKVTTLPEMPGSPLKTVLLETKVGCKNS